MVDDVATIEIYHPITKSVISFQLSFGLTKSESIKLIVNAHTTNDNLIIYRDAAYNNKDACLNCYL